MFPDADTGSRSLGPLYVAVNSVTDTVYITNPQLSGNDTVSVLDGATCNGQVTSGCGQALKTVRVGLSPVAIAIDQASDSVYVANVGIIANGDTVSVIDGATCNGTQSSGCGQVQTITVGEGPNWIALDSGTHTAYTANLTDDSVSVINTATCNATVTSGCDQKTSTVHVGANPWALSIDQKLHSVYVANNWDDTVSVLNAATCNATVTSGCHAAPPTVQVGGAPQALLAEPTTGTLYAANELDSTVSVVNLATCNAATTSGCRSVPLTADVSKPFLNPPTKLTGGVAVDGSTKTVYVANLGAGTVSVVNSATCNAAQRSRLHEAHCDHRRGGRTWWGRGRLGHRYALCGECAGQHCLGDRWRNVQRHQPDRLQPAPCHRERRLRPLRSSGR